MSNENSIREENRNEFTVIRGCLYGLAIGDVLGFPIKFDTISTIKSKYGEEGLVDFEKNDLFPKGYYSSETQLMLYTLQGILLAYQHDKNLNEDIVKQCIYLMYTKWLNTQSSKIERRNPNELIMLAIGNKERGTINRRINNCNSSSNIIKVVPLGLLFDEKEAFRLGMEITAYTHGNPNAILAGGFLASLISCIRKYQSKDFEYSLNIAINLLKRSPHSKSLLDKIEQASKINVDFFSSEQVTYILGEGWEIEEAISFSIYCILKYKNDYKKSILNAINHSGNSDCIGAITGAILGAFIGFNQIPQEWIINIENSERIDIYGKYIFEICEKLNKNLTKGGA